MRLLGTPFLKGCTPTPTFCYDGFVLGFSFACSLRPHAKLNPRTPLACDCLEAAFGRILNWTTPRCKNPKGACSAAISLPWYET